MLYDPVSSLIFKGSSMDIPEERSTHEIVRKLFTSKPLKNLVFDFAD